jgi:hypothetical protein
MSLEKVSAAMQALCVAYAFWMGYQAPTTRQRTEDFIVASVLLLPLGFLLWRLFKPVSKSKSRLEAFRNPQWQTVTSRVFKNETVDIDGKRFWGCTFHNVTLRFNGTGLVEFMAGCSFAPNLILATDCPEAMEYAKLIEVFGSIPNTVARHVGVDKDGRTLPATFEIKESRKPKNEDAEQG